jgi:hypothetical protein
MPEPPVPVDPALLDAGASARWEYDARMYLLELAMGAGVEAHVFAPLPDEPRRRAVHFRARELLRECGGLRGPWFHVEACEHDHDED